MTSECFDECSITKFNGVVFDNSLKVNNHEVWLYSVFPKEGDPHTVYYVGFDDGYNLLIEAVDYSNLTMGYIVSQMRFID